MVFLEILSYKNIGAARPIGCFFGLRLANTARPTTNKLQKGKQTGNRRHDFSRKVCFKKIDEAGRESGAWFFS